MGGGGGALLEPRLVDLGLQMFFNYAFNIRLNIEAQSSKYWPIKAAGQGSKYWTGLTIAVFTLAVVPLAVVTLAVRTNL